MERREQDKQLKRRLNFSDLLLSAIGSTIGAGVFVLLPIAINMAGIGVILSILVAALITIIVAINYGELAASMPYEGGGYSWVADAFGRESSSFIVGWLIWFGNMGYSAFSALGFGYYVSVLFGISSPLWVSLASLFFFMAVNVITTKVSIRIEKLLTSVVLILFVLVWFSLSRSFDPDRIMYMLYSSDQSRFVNITQIMSAASLMYVLFIGFEAISTVAAEARKSEDLPKAFIYCIGIVTFVYLTTATGLLGSITSNNVSYEDFIDVGGAFVVAAALFATLATTNAGLIAASRNLYAMSRDGMIPRFIGKISRDFHTPFVAVLISGFISSLFIMTNAVQYVASLADFGYLICISMVCSSVILKRITAPDMKRPYKTLLYPYSSILGTILPLFLLIFLEESAINTGLVWILVGFFVYNFYKIIKAELAKEEVTLDYIIKQISGRRGKRRPKPSKPKRAKKVMKAKMKTTTKRG